MATVPGYSNSVGKEGGFGHGGYGRADSSTLADRLPPQNLEAERSVLGGILLDNDVLHDIVTFLTADDFYRDSHQLIYRTVTELYNDGTFPRITGALGRLMREIQKDKGVQDALAN